MGIHPLLLSAYVVIDESGQLMLSLGLRWEAYEGNDLSMDGQESDRQEVENDRGGIGWAWGVGTH